MTGTKRFYAVLIGRGGPAIYANRDDVDGLSGASGKGFETASQARRWLFGKLKDMSGIIDTLPLASDSDTASGSRPHVPSYQNHPSAMQTPPSTPPSTGTLRRIPSDAPVDPATIIQPEPNITLSPAQRHVLDMVLRGKNVFFTGPAGTGKSVLLREIIKTFGTDLNVSTKLAITASTGIAALNIGGSTIHSFGGIGLGKGPIKDLVLSIRGKRYLRDRWRATKVLIIDEISMLDGSIFDKLEAIGRALQRRDNEEAEEMWVDKDFYRVGSGELPFGGIQLVLSGDFCQLPPVPDHSFDCHLSSVFAFDAQSWKTCVASPVLLTQVFRQRDEDFVEILSSMRTGKLLPHHIDKLRSLKRPLVFDDGIEPSELFPLRGQVEKCNERKLNALTTPIFSYRAMDSSGFDPYGKPITRSDAQRFLERSQATEFINLRVCGGTSYVVTGKSLRALSILYTNCNRAQNIEQGALVNGSLGIIIDFLTVREAFERKVEIARDSAEGTNSPTSKKRSRAAMEDLEEISAIPPDFSPPTSLTPLTDHVFALDQKWPLVKFTNGKELLAIAMSFRSQGFIANVETLRIQVPLALAWAMSIHKSQGQTLPRVRVDLGRVFEKGQAYVAISRATCLEGLEIHNFDPGKVEAHPRVIEWQKEWQKSWNPISDPTPQTPDSNFEEMDSEEAIHAYHTSPPIE